MIEKFFLIILWLILIGVIAVPVGLDYMNGTAKDDVLAVIQRETETDDIRITLEEEIGNKAMYCFQTGMIWSSGVFPDRGALLLPGEYHRKWRKVYRRPAGHGLGCVPVLRDGGRGAAAENRDVPGSVPDLPGGV